MLLLVWFSSLEITSSECANCGGGCVSRVVRYRSCVPRRAFLNFFFVRCVPAFAVQNLWGMNKKKFGSAKVEMQNRRRCPSYYKTLYNYIKHEYFIDWGWIKVNKNILFFPKILINFYFKIKKKIIFT